MPWGRRRKNERTDNNDNITVRYVPDIQFHYARYPALFLLSGSNSKPLVPGNCVSEPDNSSVHKLNKLH